MQRREALDWGLDNELWRVSFFIHSEMASSFSTPSSCLRLLSSSNPTRFKFTASYIHCHCRSNSNSNSYHTHQSHGIQRRWIQSFDQSLASPTHRFTVASYNILADRNASQHPDLYLNIPSRYINWDRRMRILSHELFEWNPDIICLQEVDKYFELSKILVEAGYAGSYKRRTGDSADGCAMFWKADKFNLLDGESIQYKNIGLRDNVAQLLVFERCCGNVDQT